MWDEKLSILFEKSKTTTIVSNNINCLTSFKSEFIGQITTVALSLRQQTGFLVFFNFH